MAFALLLALLDHASLAYSTVPFWVLVTAHSLTVVHAYRGATPYWLVSWLLGFLGAFGGGMSSALLLQVGRASRQHTGVPLRRRLPLPVLHLPHALRRTHPSQPWVCLHATRSACATR